MERLPSDRKLFYISVFNVPKTAKDEDIFAAFPESFIANVFPIEEVAGGYDLQFKDRAEVIKAVDCHDDEIKGEKISIALSKLTRQEA